MDLTNKVLELPVTNFTEIPLSYSSLMEMIAERNILISG